MNRPLKCVLLSVMFVSSAVLLGRFLSPSKAAAASTTETVLMMCRFDGDPQVGMVVQVITHSAGAPQTLATNCAQAVSDYINSGYRIQAQDFGGGGYPFPTYHLSKP